MGKIATNSVDVLQQVLTARKGPLLRDDQVAEVLDLSPREIEGAGNGKRRKKSDKSVIEMLLFYLRHRYLSATECLVFLWLQEIADEGGRGNVNPTDLARHLGRSRSRMSRLSESSQAPRIDRGYARRSW